MVHFSLVIYEFMLRASSIHLLYSSFIIFTAFLATSVIDVQAQINLGTFGLKKNSRGELELGFGQGGNLFGFGADRFLQATVDPAGNGAVMGGERVGVDSQLGLQQSQGLNLGNFLKLGDKPINPLESLGSLSALVKNLGGMFQPHPPSRPLVQPSRPTSSSSSVIEPQLVTAKGTEELEFTGEERQFPPAVGKGWEGEDYEELEKTLPHSQVLVPNMSIESRNGITTEGKRRNGGDGVGPPGKQEGKHDGGTDELTSKFRKLPIPDGLEMIDGSRENSKALRH